ncbi:unnamed protein product [Symbiodinium sp. CCMP2592]|nr:unnamed protein product [Symbiodinium sp. CCMP2592]
MFTQKISKDNVLQHVKDLWTSWFDLNPDLVSQGAAQQSLNKCIQFAEMTVREEMPKTRSRIQQAEEARSKRATALIQAETKFQHMDPQQLIALIELDKHAKQVTSNDGTMAKHLTLCKHSELAALVRKYPDLENHFKIQFSNNPTTAPQRSRSEDRRSPGRNNYKKLPRTPTPCPRRSTRSRGRSSSTSKSQKRHSKTRGSSKTSSRSKSRHQDGKSPGRSKGKGKGKSKGKGKGKSKSNGNNQAS